MKYVPLFGRTWKLSILAVVAALLCLVSAATAAAPPLPTRAKAFSTSGYAHRVSLTLVTSTTSPKRIERGEAVAGSQYAMSGGAVQCPKAKKGSGVHETPFAVFGFPGATLKVINGAYGFSKTSKEKTSALGGAGGEFTLKVKIAGKVISPTLIGGTVKVTGGPCTIKKPIGFKAKLDPSLPVAARALRAAPKTLHLTGEVTNDKKPKTGDPASNDFSNIALLSGSRVAGKLALKNCNGLAINELTCSGKVSLDGLGSGLEVVVRWPCEIKGDSGKFTCASVGEGFISSRQSERGTIRIGTAEPNLFKPQKRFPVTIKAS